MTSIEQMTDAVHPPGVEAATLCEAFQLTAAAFPDAPALRVAGADDAVDWRTYAARVERIATGLHALGVRHGDTVALMLRNRPEFNLIDTAALHLGATPFSIYNTSAPEQIAHLLRNAQSRVLVTERGFLAQVDAADLGATEHLVVIDGAGDETRMDLARLELLPSPELDFEAAWRAVTPADVATLIYTSGTTGPPKGVELTHANVLFTVRAADRRVRLRARGRLISYLPSAHIADRLSAHYFLQATGSCLTTVADPRDVAAALPECEPTILLGVPRIWEKLRDAMLAEVEAAPPALRAELERRLDAGIRRVRAQQADEPIDPQLAARADAGAAAFAPIRARFGFGRTEWLMAGGAQIPLEVHEFFSAIDLPLCEGWGMSETTGLGTYNDPRASRIGSVGQPLPETELRRLPDGELLVRGPHVMRGYRNDPGRTAEALDDDGWLHTGDIGTIDERGFVRIVDRKKELIINAAGKNMSPANIEAKLRGASTLIGHACCIGDGRRYNVALIALDPEAAVAYAHAHGLADGSVAAVAADMGARAAIAAAVERANAQLSRVEQIKRHVVLTVEWPPDGDELTATSKLKRRRIDAKYADVIEELYAPSQGDAR